MATLAMFFRRPLAAAPVRSGAAQAGPLPPDGRFLLRALPNEDVFLYSKRIDNSRVVREADPGARGEWSAIGMVCLLALLLIGVLTPAQPTSSRVINWNPSSRSSSVCSTNSAK